MISLKDILEHSLDQLEQYKFIIDQGKEKLATFDEDEIDYYNLPKAWFFNHKGVEENWECAISVSSSKSFMKIAFLNVKKRLYLAFDNCDSSSTEMAKTILPEYSNASHSRN